MRQTKAVYMAKSSQLCAAGRLALAAVAFFVALTYAGCSGKPAEQPQPLVTVQVTTVKRMDVQRQVSTSAVLYPVNEASIVPKISAPVKKFYVNRGDHVHAGQLLVTLENKDLQAAAAQSLGAYQQAQAAYATATEMSVPEQMQSARLAAVDAKQAMDAAQKVYQSRQTLYQQGAIARNLLDQSQVTYVQARNQYQIAEAHIKALQTGGRTQMLKSAEAQLASAKAQYEAAEAQLGYSEIRSSIDGVVASTPLYPGDMASAGTPLVVVMNISNVVARGRVSPQQAAELRVGNPATIYPGGGAADGIEGRVSVVSPSVDPNSTTVEVWVEAPNHNDELKPGATVNVTMIAKSVKDALVVPAAAVLTDSDGKTTVMVVDAQNVAHQTPVQLGIREGDSVQILSGLKEGERVVTEGAYGLPDGTKVKY